jgi:hypothetical protein
MSQILTPETAAFAMLIASWQRRFVSAWTVGEIADWRQRIIQRKERPWRALNP